MLLNRFARVFFGVVAITLLFVGGCRSTSQDRIRVLEAEKAEWAREKSGLQHQNAQMRNDLLQLENRAETAEARAASAEELLAMQRPAEPAAAPQPTFDSRAFADAFDGIQGVKVETNPHGATLILASDVSFRSGRTDLSTKAQGTLKQVATALRDAPGVREVRIEGHTDSQPIRKSGWASNEELSLARARNVEKFLLNQGVASGMMRVEGHGEAKPIASNETKKGRAANRRVEIVVVGD
jgi:flagellar motor protein MotB